MNYARHIACCLALLALVAAGCSNPFAPKPRTPPDGEPQLPAPAATTPEILIDNLSRAFNDRDKDLYETLLDEDFWFTEKNCLGEDIYFNGREEELSFMGGSRDGSKQGFFERFRTFEYEFTPILRTVELGRDYPEAVPDDPDGHPAEDWVVFRGRTHMLMVDENSDGFRVDQVMNYKLRQGSDGLWRIIRWIDDPLAGGTECGSSGKLVAGQVSWAEAKGR
ncbi:MAG: hypothetical protein IT369_09650 [Candidatus Latescibacteria bacterium]|nr:hypothetical protein [Candidatus Latescibacterota bacterium]